MSYDQVPNAQIAPGDDGPYQSAFHLPRRFAHLRSCAPRCAELPRKERVFVAVIGCIVGVACVSLLFGSSCPSGQTCFEGLDSVDDFQKALSAAKAGAKLRLTDATVTGRQLTVPAGVALALRDTSHSSNTIAKAGALLNILGSVDAIGCTFAGGRASEAGAVNIMPTGSFRCDTCVFSHNTAKWGGAINNDQARLTLLSPKFLGNVATNGAKNGSDCVCYNPKVCVGCTCAQRVFNVSGKMLASFYCPDN